MLTEKMKDRLVEEAFKAREKSYSPYSRFKVGAALLTPDGQVHTGANIENASYGATICAERTAAVKAVSAGSKEIVALAVVGSEEDPAGGMDFAYPCGICRQFLREFLPASGDMVILVARGLEDYRETSLNALLPHSFGPSDLDYLRET